MDSLSDFRLLPERRSAALPMGTINSWDRMALLRGDDRVDCLRMSDDKPKGTSAYRKLMDFILVGEQHKREREDFRDFFDYIETADSPGIRIELPHTLFTEATRAQIGRYTARRDPPHFAGDEYHGHCDVGGGHEVAWTISGVRRHPSKFPAQIPRDARSAVAKVLGVSTEILESFWIDEPVGRVLLIEARPTSS